MTSPFIQQIADNRICQVLTCLHEKFVVDFANGIDVAQEHIRTAGERTFFRRLKEVLTGEGAARQNAINASLAQGVEASLRWLTEITTSLATTNYAITRVNDRVSSLAVSYTHLIRVALGHVTVQLPDVWWMYLGGPLGLMSIGLMAILVRGLGLLMLGVASTAGQLLGSVLIDVLIPSLGNTVYLVTIIGTLFALVGAVVTTLPEYRTSKTMKKMEV